MRNPHAPSILWECLSRPLVENRGSAGPPNSPQAPILLPAKPGLGGYVDFSVPCQATAPQSLPCAERAFEEPGISFQPPAWHVAASESKLMLPVELASGSGGLEEGSPTLGETSKKNLITGNVASDAENKAVQWRMEKTGRWPRCGLAGLIFHSVHLYVESLISVLTDFLDMPNPLHHKLNQMGCLQVTNKVANVKAKSDFHDFEAFRRNKVRNNVTRKSRDKETETVRYSLIM